MIDVAFKYVIKLAVIFQTTLYCKEYKYLNWMHLRICWLYLQRVRLFTRSILGRTLNCIWWWGPSSWQCEVTLHWHYFFVHCGPKVVVPVRVPPPTHLAEVVEYTTAPLQKDKTPLHKQLSWLWLNHLMVRLQSWSFGECGVPLHYHCS